MTNANPSDPTLIAAIARRAAKKPTTTAKWTNQRITFEEALAYAEEADRQSNEVQGYTASRSHSTLGADRSWNLKSDGDEWLATVWADEDGAYHIQRDVRPGGEPFERARFAYRALPELDQTHR